LDEVDKVPREKNPPPVEFETGHKKAGSTLKERKPHYRYMLKRYRRGMNGMKDTPKGRLKEPTRESKGKRGRKLYAFPRDYSIIDMSGVGHQKSSEHDSRRGGTPGVLEGRGSKIFGPRMCGQDMGVYKLPKDANTSPVKCIERKKKEGGGKR